jgi:CheY-specific phosphatase CheX
MSPARASYLHSMLDVDSISPVPDGPTMALDVGVDSSLLKAVLHGTELGLRMTRCKLTPVGTSRIAMSRHGITVGVGLVGRHSGNMALNLSEAAALHLAGALLGSSFHCMDEDCIDAVMELGNMVAGGMKRMLAETVYVIENISLPSLVMGHSYAVGHSRGVQAVSVEFELPEMPFSSMSARYFSTTLSLLRSSGG